jgi:hypothetical protein
MAANNDLTPKQQKLDVNNDGKITGDDLKKVRDGELNEEGSVIRTSSLSAVLSRLERNKI